MENNKKIQNFTWIIYIFILIIGCAAIYFIFQVMAPLSDKKIENVESQQSSIKTEKYDKIVNPTDYGTPISTSEDGFGRTNPFAAYK